MGEDEKRKLYQWKRLKVLKELRKKITILKPDQGKNVALLKQKDYKNCLGMLLTDQNKLKRTNKDPTLMRLRNVQIYVNKLSNCDEINKEKKK